MVEGRGFDFILPVVAIDPFVTLMARQREVNGGFDTAQSLICEETNDDHPSREKWVAITSKQVGAFTYLVLLSSQLDLTSFSPCKSQNLIGEKVPGSLVPTRNTREKMV
jgi:hypothetical protein